MLLIERPRERKPAQHPADRTTPAQHAARHRQPHNMLDDLVGELPPSVLREIAAAELDR
jgi:hypothetical protein